MVGVRPWAVAVGLSCIAAAAFSSAVITWARTPEPPPGPCENTAVTEYGRWEHRCHRDADLQVWPAGVTDHGTPAVLIKCVCRRGGASGGADAGSTPAGEK